MRVLSVSLTNFASYQSLEFDFMNQGLTLIEGPTGSGKSTLCDAIPWVLFGTTAKGGPVSEVLSWPGDKITQGTINLNCDAGLTTVRRVRGAKAKDNDLYFKCMEYPEGRRGKDIPDTQRLINQRLGLTPELYLAGAYYHEFSQTAQFFTTTAKHRRVLCEQLVDLSLPKRLQESSSAKIKATDKHLQQATNEIASLTQKAGYMAQVRASHSLKAKQWGSTQAGKIKHLESSLQSWDVEHGDTIARYEAAHKKALLEHKPGVCSECGQQQPRGLERPKHSGYEDVIKELKASKNPFISQLKAAKAETSPYTDGINDASDEIADLTAKAKDMLRVAESLRGQIADLELLSEVTADFRSSLIRDTIAGVEDETNRILAEHFDAEIRVVFTAQDADKLEVEITKDGNIASFTQLSKGQRQLLKLSFGVSVMKAVANHHGDHFSQIFVDEALDGMDDKFKAKAFSLFEALAKEYESVFAVEHSSDFKSRFSNSYAVSLTNGSSTIEKV